MCYRNGNSVIRLRISATASAPLPANGMHRIFGVPIAEQNAELVAISRITYTSLQETPLPKAESAFPRLSEWLNRTLRSIVPKTPDWPRSPAFDREGTKTSAAGLVNQAS